MSHRAGIVLALTLFTASGCHSGGPRGQGGTAQPGDPCNGTVDCTPGSICFNQVCVGDGALRFSMAWQGDTDIDLHVLTPGGEMIYYGLRSAGGGTLDVDDCVSGTCSSPGAVHVENVVFDSSAAAGVYTYWAVNYAGTQSLDVTVEVFTDTDHETFTDTLPAVSGAEGTRHTFSY